VILLFGYSLLFFDLSFGKTGVPKKPAFWGGVKGNTKENQQKICRFSFRFLFFFHKKKGTKKM